MNVFIMYKIKKRYFQVRLVSIQLALIYLMLPMTGYSTINEIIKSPLQIQFIKGIVINSDTKKPIVGTLVYYDNKKTITDDNGEFKINIHTNSVTIRVSNVGYVTKTIKWQGAPDYLTIELQPDNKQIEEVIVHTGYQTLKANEVNGAITVVNKESLENRYTPNILDRLEGQANGLSFQVGRANMNPQNKTGITVRGYSTINGPLDPLIVVDNFVYDGDINTINPSDVESVNILKDAAATSIYGARGGNGVIVITTKRGQSGKLVLAVDINHTISKKPNLQALPLMSNNDYINVEETLFEAGYFNSMITNRLSPAITPIVYFLDQLRKNKITKDEYEYQKSMYSSANFRQQYSDVFFQNSMLTQYNMSLSSGNEIYKWYISAGHNLHNNQYGDPNKRTTLRINNDIKISNKLKANISASFAQNDKLSHGSPSYSNLMTIGRRQEVPYITLYDLENKEMPFYQLYNKNLIDTIGKGRLLDWNYYPITNKSLSENNIRNEELLANISLHYQVINGLNVAAYYQINRSNMSSENLYYEDSFYVRNLINRFSQINETTGQVTYNIPKGDIINFGKGNSEGQSFRTQIDFARSYISHTLKAFIGFEARENSTNGGSWTNYGYYSDPLSYTPVNFYTPYRVLPSGISTIQGSPTIEPTIINRFVSLYGNFAYSFLNKYSISGSMRKDGSNIYGVSTNDKWKPLWSIALGYDIMEENFMPNTVFNSLRFRSSLGYSGNVDLSKSALPIAYYYNNDPSLGSYRVALIETLNNPSLRWEQLRQINVGLDFSFLTIPLSGTFDYYTKEGSDLYGITAYDYTTWGARNTITKNVADMSGKGIDFSLTYNHNSRIINWSSSLIYNYSQSKTEKYYEPNDLALVSRMLGRSDKQITPLDGYPLYSIGAYVWKGLDDNGNPQGLLHGAISTDYSNIINSAQLDGVNSGAIKFIGSAIPTHFGSWYNQFSRNGLAISINLMYKMGYYFRRPSINYSALVNYGSGHVDFENRWQKSGDVTTVPSFQYPLVDQDRDDFYLSSEHLVKKADHIRLQFVNVAYDLKEMLGLSKLSLYAQCNNLGIIWKVSSTDVDPDYAFQIPPSKTFVFGLRAQF